MSDAEALPWWSRRTVRRFSELTCRSPDQTEQELVALRHEVEGHVADMPRPVRVLLLAAFVAFDQLARLRPSSFGRRFATLPGAKAETYLASSARSRWTWRRGLTRVLRTFVVTHYYDLPEVWSRLGYAPDPYIERIARDRVTRYAADIAAADRAVFTDPPGAPMPGDWRDRIFPGDTVTDDVIECDVVVVGSGAGGATMAAELADAGLDVVILEEGLWHSTESFTTSTGRSLRTLYRDTGLEVALGTPPILLSEGRCVGGSTVINGAMAWPTPDDVLERWGREEALSGISSQALAPYFRRVEHRLSVAIQDPQSIGRDDRLLERGATIQGWRIVDNRRAQVHCAGCDMCTLGCPTTAKRSMLVTNIPRALSRGARLYTGCHVERIMRDGKRVTGAVVRTTGAVASARTFRVRSRVVVASGGALQTPALLHRSGISAPSKALGRNLALHPNAKVVAFFDEEVRAWQGVHQAFQIREFMDQGILISAVNLPPALLAGGLPYHGSELAAMMRNYNHVVVGGCLIEDSVSGRVMNVPGVGPLARYQISGRDFDRIVRGVSLTAEVMFAAGAKSVLMPFDGVPPLTSPDQVRALNRWGLRERDLELVSIHLMGTARMSDDRSRGVVSGYGEFHDAAGLFIADASILPGPVGVNPMESIMALVTRSAEFLLSERKRLGL